MGIYYRCNATLGPKSKYKGQRCKYKAKIKGKCGIHSRCKKSDCSYWYWLKVKSWWNSYKDKLLIDLHHYYNYGTVYWGEFDTVFDYWLNEFKNYQHQYTAELKDWTLHFGRAVRNVGLADPNKNKIWLSRHFVTYNCEGSIRNILLHEIAHVLVGCDQSHNSIWVAKAIEIGCDGKLGGEHAVPPKPKYIIKCNCHSYKRYIKPRIDYTSFICRVCRCRYEVFIN